MPVYKLTASAVLTLDVDAKSLKEAIELGEGTEDDWEIEEIDHDTIEAVRVEEDDEEG